MTSHTFFFEPREKERVEMRERREKVARELAQNGYIEHVTEAPAGWGAREGDIRSSGCVSQLDAPR